MAVPLSVTELRDEDTKAVIGSRYTYRLTSAGWACTYSFKLLISFQIKNIQNQMFF